jgi:hypothetical protein
VNRHRYEGYIEVRNAIEAQVADEYPSAVLEDLAEGLLLARSKGESIEARDRVPDALGLLVDRGDLTQLAADRFWVHLKACGPRMSWPPSWRRPAGPARQWAMPGL